MGDIAVENSLHNAMAAADDAPSSVVDDWEMGYPDYPVDGRPI